VNWWVKSFKKCPVIFPRLGFCYRILVKGINCIYYYRHYSTTGTVTRLNDQELPTTPTLSAMRLFDKIAHG